jgi:hypothetical protein
MKKAKMTVLTFNKKDVLKKAAFVLGNSENLMPDVMEFCSEVTKVLVARRRKDEDLQKKMAKKMMRNVSTRQLSDYPDNR